MLIGLLRDMSFHSINIPSEWGRSMTLMTKRRRRHVSIQLISPASGDHKAVNLQYEIWSFHSINIPSEWGPNLSFSEVRICCLVSIQLISPASGDSSIFTVNKLRCLVLLSFHSINIPSEWGRNWG